jgi:hypothetical protein
MGVLLTINILYFDSLRNTEKLDLSSQEAG